MPKKTVDRKPLATRNRYAKQRKPWEDLTAATKFLLWRLGDERVPKSYKLKQEKLKDEKWEKHNWESLAASTKIIYYHNQDPRVPEGWVPPYKAFRPITTLKGLKVVIKKTEEKLAHLKSELKRLSKKE